MQEAVFTETGRYNALAIGSRTGSDRGNVISGQP